MEMTEQALYTSGGNVIEGATACVSHGTAEAESTVCSPLEL